MVQVEVRSKVPGADSDVMPDVLVELAEERVLVRDLIRRAVAEQVRLLRVDRPRCRRALDQQYLSADEVRAQAATGKVQLPAATDADIDPDRAVGRALRAFTRRTFVIFIGGRQAHDLDEEVVLRLGEPVVFLRLTALVGG